MHRSSIGRELTQNTDDDGVYRGAHAHRTHLARKKYAKRKYSKIKGKLRQKIQRQLKRFWSPEQIAGRQKKKGTVLCHETVYQFVYEKRPDLVKCLRRQKNKYRKKRGSGARIARNRAMKIKRIGERPEIVATRSRIGDWEGDTVVGKEKTQRILTNVDRKSGYGMADKLDVVTAEIVFATTIQRFTQLPKIARCTLTRDNGTEFGDYDHDVEKKTGMDVYRAEPYHSWERGTNENWNGLLRQFFPKGTYFATITQYDVDRAVRLINDRPRKRLGYATPREVFRQCCNSD
jgi:IS30 family transposase